MVLNVEEMTAEQLAAYENDYRATMEKIKAHRKATGIKAPRYSPIAHAKQVIGVAIPRLAADIESLVFDNKRNVNYISFVGALVADGTWNVRRVTVKAPNPNAQAPTPERIAHMQAMRKLAKENPAEYAKVKARAEKEKEAAAKAPANRAG